MARRLPRMEVIEAFIEAARAPNFRTAAERCSLSPAAFSRRIQAFTQFAGRDLFEKGPAGMRLTEVGRNCLEGLEPSYLEMRRAAFEIGAPASRRRVTISLSHSLAVGWLIPRLDRFHAAQPGLEVVLRTERTATAIRSGDVDLGICASDIDLSGLSTRHMLDLDISPVASPAIAEQIRRGRKRMEDFQLLGMAQHPDMWPWWAAETGWTGGALSAGTAFDVLHAMYEAAAAGLGIAAGISVTVTPHLRSGRLVHLGLPSARYPGGYSLAVTASRARGAEVRLLWRWLVSEADRNVTDWEPALTTHAQPGRQPALA